MTHSDSTLRTVYGVRETNGLGPNAQATYHQEDRSLTVDWTDKRLRRVTRLRLVSDPGFPAWDVTYCHGELHDGTLVHVQVPFSGGFLRKYGATISSQIVKFAIKDGVHAKRLGVLDCISTLN